MNLKEFKKDVVNPKILLLDSVNRQSTIYTIHNENLASHSFKVAYIALTIAKKLNLSREEQNQITTYALIHDVGESTTSDLPSNIKRSVPGLKELLDEAEKIGIAKHNPEILNEFLELQQHEKEKDLTGIIVKLADILAFLMVVEQEKALGNRDKTLLKAEANSTKQLREYFDSLKETLEYKNRCDNIEKYLMVELKDDNTKTGGVSYQGETLMDFLSSVDEKPNNMNEVNKLLKECGIEEIKL